MDDHAGPVWQLPFQACAPSATRTSWLNGAKGEGMRRYPNWMWVQMKCQGGPMLSNSLTFHQLSTILPFFREIMVHHPCSMIFGPGGEVPWSDKMGCGRRGPSRFGSGQPSHSQLVGCQLKFNMVETTIINYPRIAFMSSLWIIIISHAVQYASYP